MKRFMNMIMSLVMVSIIGGAGVSLVKSDVALAGGPCKPDSERVLGFPYWYRGLDVESTSTSCEIKAPGNIQTFIGQIAVNLVEVAMVAVGYISFAFIVMGGFQFITSLGSSEKMAAARTTIMNACIGLVIAISSTAIIRTFMGILPGGDLSAVTPENVLTGVLDIVYFAAGAASVVVIIISGFTMVTSGDKPESVAKARNGIMFSAIGIVIIVFAKLITSFISGRF